MNKQANSDKEKKKSENKRKRRTALIICRNGKQFWTTQTEFWQWVRNLVVVKTADQPLTGFFRHEHEELLVLMNHTVLNLGAPNHLNEMLLSRRNVKNSRRGRRSATVS